MNNEGILMRVFSFATNEQLEAGVEWNCAIIGHLDKQCRPERFAGKNDRINYFGINLPERLDSMNVVEAFNAWMKSKAAGAPGCDLLQSLWESIRDLDHIMNEKMIRGD